MLVRNHRSNLYMVHIKVHIHKIQSKDITSMSVRECMRLEKRANKYFWKLYWLIHKTKIL